MSDDPSRFVRLLLKYDRALIAYIMTFIPRRDDAEEVLQNAATVIWEKFSEYDKSRDFLPWAMRVTYFEILNFRKERARSRLVFCPELLEALATDRATQESVLEARREALRVCLGQLDQEAESLLRQRYADSETIADLAKSVGASAKVLYRRLYRLRQRVARCVEQRLLSEST